MINMIDRNNKWYKTKWISEWWESRKKEIKTDTDFGKKRNSERNENINIRIENIISLNFSNNLDIKNFKEILMYE
jgi:hypothetical protein